MSYQPPFTITTKILDQISDISILIGQMEALKHNVVSPKLRKINRIKTLTGTLQIEGNPLDEEKITAILDGRKVLATVRELAEVQGAIKAYDNLEKYQYNSLDDLLSAHYKLMGGILKDAGKFRNKNVGVGSHIAPPVNVVAGLMEELFSWLGETTLHPLIVSSIFHYEFEFIHPFIDGNGRVGRLWQSVILYHWKEFFTYIPVESVIRDHQNEYYKAIEASEDLGESTPFIEFMLESIKEALADLPKSDQVNDQVSDQVRKLLDVMDERYLSSSEIMQKLGLSHKPTFRKNYLNPALESTLIEMSEPNSPRSPKQKYRVINKSKR